MVLHELDDDPDVVGVVLDGDDPHDVGRVLRVGVLAILVGQHQARVGFVNLVGNTSVPLEMSTYPAGKAQLLEVLFFINCHKDVVVSITFAFCLGKIILFFCLHFLGMGKVFLSCYIDRQCQRTESVR